MKKIVLSVCAVAAMSSLGIAGGDMATVEPVVTIPVVVEDESSFYVGLGLSGESARDADISVDWDGAKRQDRVWNVSFLVGYDFNKYFDVEGRYAISFAHENQVEMSGWSLFAKPKYPVSEDFSVYVLLGYGGVTLDGLNGYIVDVDDTGFQWGLGASYQVMENLSLFADYTFPANDMDGIYMSGAVQVDVDAFTVGVKYNF